MPSYAKVILIGNLGRDPELKYTPQGTPMCQFSMACSEKRKDRTGEMKENTTWFRVTMWGKQAEIANQYLQKGKPVYIEGKIRSETYTDRDGKERTSLEVNASEMQFIGSREDGGGMDRGGYQQSAPQQQQRPPQQRPPQQQSGSLPMGGPSDITDEDVPF